MIQLSEPRACEKCGVWFSTTGASRAVCALCEDQNDARPIFTLLVEGPYRGRYAVKRKGDRKIKGIRWAGPNKGERWSRPPYYGHVWRDGSQWLAIAPGGNVKLGSYRTRREAGVACLLWNRPA